MYPVNVKSDNEGMNIMDRNMINVTINTVLVFDVQLINNLSKYNNYAVCADT